jgi:hypothetical protein
MKLREALRLSRGFRAGQAACLDCERLRRGSRLSGICLTGAATMQIHAIEFTLSSSRYREAGSFLRSIALSWRNAKTPQSSLSLQRMQRIGNLSIMHRGKSEMRRPEGRRYWLPHALHLNKAHPHLESRLPLGRTQCLKRVKECHCFDAAVSKYCREPGRNDPLIVYNVK